MPQVPPSERVCIFCGETAETVEMSTEDAWPLWALKLVKPREPGRYFTSERGSVSKPHRIIRTNVQGRPARQTTRNVCKPCNEGWMSTLEETAKPILEPMILGEPQSLAAEDRQTLALWAIKTALTLNDTAKDDPVPLPVELFRLIHQQVLPPDHRVFAAPVKEEDGVRNDEKAGMLADEDGEMIGYFSILVCQRISFQIIGGPLDFGPMEPDYFAQLWPADAALLWPPDKEIPRPKARGSEPPPGTPGYPDLWRRRPDAPPQPA